MARFTGPGDPRVIAVLLVALSSVYAAVVVWGLSLLDLAEFTPVNVATLALVIVAVTYVLVLR